MAHSVIFIILLVVFRGSLDLSYWLVLSPHFSSVGYVLEFELFQYLLSWSIYVLMFFTLRSRFYSIRDYFFITLVLGLWGPLTSIWGLDSNRPMYPLLVCFFGYYSIYFSMIFFSKVAMIHFPKVRGGRDLAFNVSLILTVFLVFWYLYSGVSLNLDLSKVYEYRRANEELSAFGFFAYLNNWIYKIFAVFLLSYFLMKGQIFRSFLVILVFVFYFSANSHKSVLFTPFLVFFIWFYFSRYTSMVLVPLSFSLIILSSILTFYFLGDVWMSALFPNRVFMIPAHLTFVYFDFFEFNQFIYYSNSFLKSYLEYPYEIGLAQLIGEYSGNPGVAANNGYVSSAYAQLGVYAVIVYSIFLGAFIAIIDRFIAKKEIPPWFALAILVVPIRDLLISIDLLTTLLTGGMIWSIILIFLSRKKVN